jgi:hypothetical protein
MTPAQKIRAVFELTELAVSFTEAGVRRMYPAASEREIFLRVAARRLDRETMRKVYGWDPESDDDAASRSWGAGQCSS